MGFSLYGGILAAIIPLINGQEISFYSVIHCVLNTEIGSENTGVLWFLQNLTVVYLFFPIAKKIYDCDYRLFKYLYGILMISTFGYNIISVFINLISCITECGEINNILVFLDKLRLNIGDNLYTI